MPMAVRARKRQVDGAIIVLCDFVNRNRILLIVDGTSIQSPTSSPTSAKLFYPRSHLVYHYGHHHVHIILASAASSYDHGWRRSWQLRRRPAKRWRSPTPKRSFIHHSWCAHCTERMETCLEKEPAPSHLRPTTKTENRPTGKHPFRIIRSNSTVVVPDFRPLHPSRWSHISNAQCLLQGHW